MMWIGQKCFSRFKAALMLPCYTQNAYQTFANHKLHKHTENSMPTPRRSRDSRLRLYRKMACIELFDERNDSFRIHESSFMVI